MLNNSVVSFYDNFGLIFRGSDDKATNDIKNWWLSTTPLLIGASRENRSEYPHIGPTLCRQRLLSLANISVADSIRVSWIFIRFHTFVLESEAEKSTDTNDKNEF